MRLIEIYHKLKDQFPVRLLTGSAGTLKRVRWIHMIEDLEAAGFINGNELIFTTGIAGRGESWLLKLVQRLHENHAGGLVVNTGPHIREIPEAVKKYGEEHDFVLMEMPWDVHLVDVFKYISGILLDQEKRRAGIVSAMKDAVFYPGGSKGYREELKRYGYDTEKSFCPVIAELPEISEKDREETADYLEDMLSFYFRKITVFKFNQYIIMVLYDSGQEETADCCQKVKEYENNRELLQIEGMASGPNREGIEHLSQSYQAAERLLGLGKRRQQKVLLYDDMGVYQMLLTHPDKETLKIYAEHMLGALMEYDARHKTDYMRILRYYLETDGSVQETARVLNYHRNTINHRMQNIRQILGKEKISGRDKAELLLAIAAAETEGLC